MPRTEGIDEVTVVFAALVGVGYQEANGGAGGVPFVNARNNLHRIGLIALGDVFGGTRTAAV